MTATNELTGLTACPRCDKAPLTERVDGYRCDACKIDYPTVAGMPWLFAEPEATMGEWRNRLHFAIQRLAADSQRMQGERKSIADDSLTAKRLDLQITAVDEHRNHLRRLLAPFDVQSSQTSVETYLALRTRLPVDHGIATYYHNIHRDWAWGDTENRASLEQVSQVAGEMPLGDTLILGAGAGRLAYDIHRQLDVTRTVATDFNPLLMLVARTVTGGKELELYEFPIAPKSIEDFAVKRTLSAPEPVGGGFHLVFSDVLRPPFGAGSFDTVVTPWLIDVVGDDLAIQAARINRLLRGGGRWINFGSLTFNDPDMARCYSAEEAVAIVEQAGFGKLATQEATIPYMCSPASRHGRQETVFTFAAEKHADVKAPERHKALPDWIVTGREAVPALPAFRNQAMSTRIYGFVMSMIDGQRTIEDMAELMAQQQLMSKTDAVPAIRRFLTRMYDDARKGGGY